MDCWQSCLMCVCVCVCVCICIYIYTNTYTYMYIYIQTHTHARTRTLAKLWPCTLNNELLIFFWTSVISDRLSGFRPLRVKENSPRWTKITTISIIIIVTFFFSSSGMLQSLVVQLYKSYSGCRTVWLTIHHFEKLLSHEQTVKQPCCNGDFSSLSENACYLVLCAAEWRCRPKRDVACTTRDHLTYCCW